MAAEVELAGITKRFERRADGDTPEGAALKGIDLSVNKGELLVVVGPSGCGKSTTLRIIAGLEEADGGTLTIGGKSMNGVAPQDRDVAMVFQGYALYPQMTVRENIEFPLKMRKVDVAERRKRSDEAASMLALTKLMDRLPAELSGGERQRVAMGRAIVRRPRVFLFDEPLSNLDAALRQDLRVQIGVLVRELGVTAIYVTHDQVEAMTLADRICLMKKGEIQQVAAPRTIYESPATSFVGTFIGAPKMNLLRGTVADGRIRCGPFELAAPDDTKLPDEVVIGVRPEDVKITDGVFSNPELTVGIAEPLGAETNLVLKGSDDLTLRARTHGFDPRATGAKVNVSLEGARFHVFEAGEGGRRLGPTA